jgi:hypothetical protein
MVQGVNSISISVEIGRGRTKGKKIAVISDGNFLWKDQ